MSVFSERAVRGTQVSGFEVYRSPEFQALCERFGIAWGLPTKSLTITLTEDEMVVVQTYPGTAEPEKKANKPIDTTTLQNETWRTAMPRPDHEVGRIDR